MYRVWGAIKDRCFRKTHLQYKNYGGRGILLCDKWLDFNRFMEDIHSEIGEKPEYHHELDRIDNDKGYEPGNIRWSTITENQRNKRTNHYYQTHIGKICQSELIEKLGFTRKQFQRYIESRGIENLLERFKNNDIPKKHIHENVEDLIGKKIGSLTFISLNRGSKGGYSYQVQCDCGTICSIRRISLEGARKRKYFCCQKCNKKGDLNGKRKHMKRYIR